MSNRRLLIAAPLALVLVAGLPLALATAPEVLAQSTASRPRSVTEASVDILGAINAVRSAGYTAIREVEWDDGRWEVKATDGQGRRVELRVDPVSGVVTPKH